jgi:DNA-binding transcriptional LysR family regulator
MDRRLRQFLAIAETGNVSAAADLLHVTQPTVSVNLQKLEDEHGVKLFDRSSRGMTLTDFGEVLYEHVKVMARVADHANAEIRLLKASQEKAVRIGTGFSWWSLFVKDLIRDFQRDNAGTSIHVDVCSSLDGLRSLMIGDIAFFLGTKIEGLSENSGFVFEQLFEVMDSHFVGGHHPLNGRPCDTHDLATYPRLSVSAFGNRHIGIVDRDDLDPSFSRSKSSAVSFVSTNSMFAGIDLLKETDAILTYPAPTEAFFKTFQIARLDVLDVAPTLVPIGIYSLGTKTVEARVLTLQNSIRDTLLERKLPSIIIS